MTEDEAIFTAIALVTATRHGDEAAPQMAYDVTADREDACMVLGALAGMVVASMSEEGIRRFAQAAAGGANRG